MKKVFYLCCGTIMCGCVALFCSMNTSGSFIDVTLNGCETLAMGEDSSGGCKWKEIDCPGIFTGDYEACLDNGDGNSCTCGSTTRDCK